MSLTPAVSRDGFAFAGSDLYAEASGHNRHRRASPAELKAHFQGGSDKDHPAHWFEAQLIHYGLPPSKTKAVARMRLYDAVKAGGLTVPARIKTLEADLKKQWTRDDRETKKALSAASGSGSARASGSKTTSSSAATAAKKGTKRKADESSSNTVDLTISAGGVDIKVSTSSRTSKSTKSATSSTAAASASKKAKTTKEAKTTKATPTPKSSASSTTKPKASSSASKPKASSSAPKPKAPSSASKPKASSRPPASSSAPKPAKKQTAKRGGHSQASGRSAASGSPVRSHPPGRTARRGGAFSAGGRGTASTSSPARASYGYGGGGGGFDDDDDDAPPPYSEYDDDYYGHEKSDQDSDDSGSDVELQPLGLLNGRYDVYSPDVTEQWDQWDESDFSLILTLRGDELWGRFELGVVQGVLRLNKRPYQSSNEKLSFQWRGREDDGPIVYGDDNYGWLRFLGGGRIEGYLDYQSLGFQAERLSGQSTRSEIDAATLRSDWYSYNEREYEEENRARWG